jgi:hypothetical protein
MLRTSLAILAMMLFVGAAHAASDATSESDAIQLDQGTEPSSPGSAMEHQPNTSPDPAEQNEMQESDDINN